MTISRRICGAAGFEFGASIDADSDVGAKVRGHSSTQRRPGETIDDRIEVSLAAGAARGGSPNALTLIRPRMWSPFIVEDDSVLLARDDAYRVGQVN